MRTILILLCGLSGFANSQWESEKSALYARKSQLISQTVHRKISRAQALMGSKDYDGAFSILNKLAKRKGGKTFEKAQVHQTMGFLYAQSDKLKQAIASFQKALSFKILPAGPTLNTMYTLAQLYVAEEQHPKAVATLEKWLYFAKDPKPAAYILIATAHAELKQFKKALPYVKKALDSGGEMKENWLQFAVALNYEVKDYKSALVALKILTSKYPQKAKYWKQLSGIYLNLDDNKQALVSLALAHKLGHLDKDTEILNLASLYLDQNVPLKAAKLLEQGLESGLLEANAKHFEVLSAAWLSARETAKAKVALVKAAPLAEHGNIYAQLGSLHLDSEKWQKAAKALKMALKKGKLRQAHQVRLGLGIALFQLQQFEPARKQFLMAGKDKTTKIAARQWIAHIESEQGRIQGTARN